VTDGRDNEELKIQTTGFELIQLPHELAEKDDECENEIETNYRSNARKNRSESFRCGMF